MGTPAINMHQEATKHQQGCRSLETLVPFQKHLPNPMSPALSCQLKWMQNSTSKLFWVVFLTPRRWRRHLPTILQRGLSRLRVFLTRLWGSLPLQLLKHFFALKTFIFFLCLPQGSNGVPCPLGSPPACGGLHLPGVLQNRGYYFPKARGKGR